MILYALAALGILVFTQKETIVETVEEKMDFWTKYDSLFKKYGEKYNVPWTWLKAIALNESDLGRHPSVVRGISNPKDEAGSKSSDGKSWGLMQVTLTTARDMDPTASTEKLNNPEYSVGLAAKYIDWLGRYFPQSDSRRLEWLIKSYNQGPGNSLKERRGEIKGYAGEYWIRFQRNLKRVEGSL